MVDFYPLLFTTEKTHQIKLCIVGTDAVQHPITAHIVYHVSRIIPVIVMSALATFLVLQRVLAMYFHCFQPIFLALIYKKVIFPLDTNGQLPMNHLQAMLFFQVHFSRVIFQLYHNIHHAEYVHRFHMLILYKNQFQLTQRPRSWMFCLCSAAYLGIIKHNAVQLSVS